MPSMLGSRGVALATATATAVVISGTVAFIAFSKHQVSRPSIKALRSCFTSDGKTGKEASGNGEGYRRQYFQRMSPEFDGGLRQVLADLYTGPDTRIHLSD